MSLMGLVCLGFYALLQIVPIPLLTGDVLDEQEKTRLAAAQNVESRIKIYHDASKRMQLAIAAAAGSGDFTNMPGALNLWVELLSGSLKDIDASLKARKKSKALIRYEIQVRKALAAMKGYKIKAPIEQQDAFDSRLAEAESIRKKFVEIIFR